MEKDGIASVWIGNAKSQEAVKDFLRIRYTKGGDSIRSSFAVAFDMRRENDPDFTEWTRQDSPTQDVRKLLKPHSYSKEIAPKIVQLIGETLPEAANTVILLHGFEYDGSPIRGTGVEIDVRFAGAVSFDPTAD